MKTPILILTAFSLATAATAQGGMQTPTPPATPDAAMPAPAVSPDPATAAPTMAAPPAAAPMPDATAPAAAPSAMMATPAPNAMPAATATTDSASYPTCSRTVKDKCVNRGSAPRKTRR